MLAEDSLANTCHVSYTLGRQSYTTPSYLQLGTLSQFLKVQIIFQKCCYLTPIWNYRGTHDQTQLFRYTYNMVMVNCLDKIPTAHFTASIYMVFCKQSENIAIDEVAENQSIPSCTVTTQCSHFTSSLKACRSEPKMHSLMGQ